MKSFFFFTLLCVLVLYSCQKEPGRVTTSTQTMVKRMELTSMGISASFGGKDNIDFVYDIAGRVASMKAYNVILFPNAAYYDSIFHIRFEYNSSNNLPYKVTIMNYSTTIHTMHFIKYNVANQPVADSVLTLVSSVWMFDRFSTYTYSGNSVLYKDSTSFGPGTLTTIFTGANGNYYNYGQPPTYSQYYEFDNGDNPLNQLNIAPIFFCLTNARRPIADIWSIWSFTNKNNLTMIKLDFNPTLGIARDTTFFSNNYNANGVLQKRYWIEKFYGAPTGPFIDTTDRIEFIY